MNDGIERTPTTSSAPVAKPSNVAESVNLTALMDNSVNAAIQGSRARANASC